MTISTHVLDTSLGRPASAVAVQLLRQQGKNWIEISGGETNADGRMPSLLSDAASPGPGAYRLTFDVGAYFDRRGVEAFYGIVTIDFIVRDGESHYHVPLLVSPYGYSTYRGS
jgi:5-hydroxyisourate hydrolase